MDLPVAFHLVPSGIITAQMVCTGFTGPSLDSVAVMNSVCLSELKLSLSRFLSSKGHTRDKGVMMGENEPFKKKIYMYVDLGHALV